LLAHLKGEGVESPAKDGIGAIVEGVERENHAATPDPDKAGVEEVSWKLAGHLATRIVPGKGKSRGIQKIQIFF
jgi:hypothetical protein